MIDIRLSAMRHVQAIALITVVMRLMDFAYKDVPIQIATVSQKYFILLGIKHFRILHIFHFL